MNCIMGISTQGSENLLPTGRLTGVSPIPKISGLFPVYYSQMAMSIFKLKIHWTDI